MSNTNWKKVVSGVLAFTMALVMAGCGDSESSSKKDNIEDKLESITESDIASAAEALDDALSKGGESTDSKPDDQPAENSAFEYYKLLSAEYDKEGMDNVVEIQARGTLIDKKIHIGEDSLSHCFYYDDEKIFFVDDDRKTGIGTIYYYDIAADKLNKVYEIKDFN